jgi:hypothetical protein
MSKDKQSTFDWNTILYKNVLSKDMRDLGKVVAMDCDSIIISRESRYRIPKSRIERFDGNNVLVDFIYNDLLLIELASLSYSIASSWTTGISNNVTPPETITHLLTTTIEPAERESNDFTW